MKITEEMFRERFLKEFDCLGIKANNFLTYELNNIAEEDFIDFFCEIIREYNLPLEKFDDFPWTRYYKHGSFYRIEQYMRRWLGKEYDKYFFEEEEPLYYDTLRDYFFTCLKKIENGDS